PQVKLAGHFVDGDFLRRTVEHYLALGQQVRPVGDGQRFLYVVVGDEDTDIARLELGYVRLYLFYGNRIYPREGFVEQDKIWIGGQRAGDLRSPPFAA